MRKIFLIALFAFIAIESFSQRYTPFQGWGFEARRLKADSVMLIPSDTTANKTGIVRIGSSLYVGNGSFWTQVQAGAILSDSAVFSTKAYRQKGVDSLNGIIATKLGLSDSSLYATRGRLYKVADSLGSVIASVSADSSVFSTKAYRQKGLDSVQAVNAATYVPYTGATANVDLGAFTLHAQSLAASGTNGSGFLRLRHQASDATANGQTTSLFANSSGYLKVKNDGLSYYTFATPITADRTYTFQDKSGTIAHISDITDSLPSAVSAIQLNLSGAIHSTPVNFTRSGRSWSGTATLADQSPFTIFRRGSGTGTPSFGTIDSSYFGGSFANQVRGVGDARYILNQTTQQVSSNFNISGNGTIGGNLDVTGTQTFTGNTRINGVVGFSTSPNSTIIQQIVTTLNSGTVKGVNMAPTLNSSSTGTYSGFVSTPTTQAASFTLNQIRDYSVEDRALGAGSAITSRIGYYFPNLSSFTSGSIWAFRSQLNSGSNRYGLFFDGTADNHLQGNTLIGTTSNPNSRKLLVSGTGEITGEATFSGGSIRLNDPTNAYGVTLTNNTTTTTLATLFGGSSFAVQTGASGTNQLLISSTGAATFSSTGSFAGNVGIGTTDLSYRGGRLVVKGANVAQGNQAILHVNSTDAQGINIGGSIGLGGQVGGDENVFGVISGRKETATSGNYAGYLAFATPDGGATTTEKMRITSAGNVGIGTNTPSVSLHVRRDAAGALGGQIAIDNSASSTLGNAAELSFLTNNGASATGIRNGRILVVNENAGNGAARMEFHTWDGAASAVRLTIASTGAATFSSSATVQGALTATAQGNNIVSTIDSTTITTSNYTLVLGDAGKRFYIKNSSSALTVTIPTDASVNFPMGTEIIFFQDGTGDITIAGASGVTVKSGSSLTKLGEQYAFAGVVKLSANTWGFTGNRK